MFFSVQLLSTNVKEGFEICILRPVRSSRHETNRAAGRRLAREEEQERRRPNRLCGLAGAEVGAAQTSGWASRHLVVDLATALAGPRLILQI